MVEESKLHGWAETTVYPSGEGGKDSPEDGGQCPICGELLRAGERVHKVTEEIGCDEWVHDKHVVRVEESK